MKPAEESSAWPLYAIPAILVLVLLVAVPLLKRLLTARGRPEDLYRDLAGRLRDVLPLSGANTIVDSPALTPTERLVLLAGTAGIEVRPFREFAQAYSESLYASHEPRSNASRAYRRALREYEKLPRWKRALGGVNPASLFLRARRRLAAYKVRLWKVLHSRIEGLKRFRGER